MRNKSVAVKDNVDTDADITAVTETWLKSDDEDAKTLVELYGDGYKMLIEPRITGRGDGIGVLRRCIRRI